MNVTLMKTVAGIGMFLMGELVFNAIVLLMGIGMTHNLTWFLGLTQDHIQLITMFENAFAVIIITIIFKILSMVEFDTTPLTNENREDKPQ